MKDELEYELQAQQEELDFLLGELEWSKDKRKVWEAITESQRSTADCDQRNQIWNEKTSHLCHYGCREVNLNLRVSISSSTKS